MENNINAKLEDRLTTFKKANNGMVATNDGAYNTGWGRNRVTKVTKGFKKEEIEKIIDSGSLTERQMLSREYFNKDGVYKRLIIHYATLLKYSGMLIPNPAYGKDLSTEHISKRYYNALDFIERMNLPDFFVNCAQKAYTDGCYYGLITKLDKNSFSVLDLPVSYCASNFKDFQGNDIIEFNVTYFNTIAQEQDREAALNTYPKIISSAYRKYSKGKRTNPWVVVPTDLGICFPTFNGLPPFLSVIPTTVDYKEAVETENERREEEIKKIIVQKIPHNTSTNELLFEPDEAEEIHSGTVGMMKGEKNIRVLTTYADVDAIVSKTTADSNSNTLETMINSIYLEAGVSNQMFSALGSNSTDASNKNDLAFAMVLARKFGIFVTNIVNSLYANGNINFKYTILPVSWQNQSEYISDSFKLAGSGYSWLLPALAMDLSQRDIVNIKDLENDVLGLKDKLMPLGSAYTQSAASQQTTKNPEEAIEDSKPGQPKKTDDQKKESTTQKDKSLDKVGGSK